VVAVQTVTKAEFCSSQTHKFKAMQKIIPTNQAKGLNVIEVAHDFVPKIKNWLTTQNIQNSFDTWHGTKGVAKAMKEIVVVHRNGRVRSLLQSCQTSCMTPWAICSLWTILLMLRYWTG